MNFVENSIEIFTSWTACLLKVQWEISTRSHFTGSNLKPSWFAEPRTQHATAERNQRGVLGDVFGNPFASVLHSLVTSATNGKTMQQSKSIPVFFFRYLEDIQFENLTQRQARGNLWLGVKNKEETHFFKISTLNFQSRNF